MSFCLGLQYQASLIIESGQNCFALMCMLSAVLDQEVEKFTLMYILLDMYWTMYIRLVTEKLLTRGARILEELSFLFTPPHTDWILFCASIFFISRIINFKSTGKEIRNNINDSKWRLVYWHNGMLYSHL